MLGSAFHIRIQTKMCIYYIRNIDNDPVSALGQFNEYNFMRYKWYAMFDFQNKYSYDGQI